MANRTFDPMDQQHVAWRSHIAHLVAQELATVDLTASERVDLTERLVERIAS